LSVLKLRQISTSNFNYNAQQVQSAPPKSSSASSNQGQQQQQRKSSGGSTVLKLLGLTVTSFALAVGYAVQNPDTRRQFESVIPQSSYLFGIIDDFSASKPNPVADFPSKIKT
jgi:hypothetical protein